MSLLGSVVVTDLHHANALLVNCTEALLIASCSVTRAIVASLLLCWSGTGTLAAWDLTAYVMNGVKLRAWAPWLVAIGNCSVCFVCLGSWPTAYQAGSGIPASL